MTIRLAVKTTCKADADRYALIALWKPSYKVVLMLDITSWLCMPDCIVRRTIYGTGEPYQLSS
jgi:hypothetical protein